MSTMEIVSVRPQDCPRLSEIAQAAKAHWGYPPAWLEAWRKDLTFTAESLDTQEIFAARVDGAMQGVCALAIDGAEAILEHLWVDPSAMGFGLGRRLYEHALDLARQAGVRRIELHADPNAVGFYEHVGAVYDRDHHGEVLGEPRILPIYVVTLDE